MNFGGVVAQLCATARMPRPARLFFARAMWRAWRTKDRTSIRSAAHPRELARLLHAARGAKTVVEIGTGMGWTAAAFTVSDPAREVISLDVWERPQRDRYLELLSTRSASGCA